MIAAIGPGSTFGRFRVEAVIGRGGMGVVLLATDLSLDRPVALKLIAPELAQDERFRRRFLKEPRLAASLDHPNVVPIYEAGERDGQLYLAMRYVQGTDLKTLLQREGKLRLERALPILAQVAGALDAAHRRGLVHRDVKPANVLLDEDEHAYLTDFGITKQTGGASTDTGQALGTLDYLAPEQIRGEPVDGRSDVYALGCVLFECLTGGAPYHRQTEAETLWAHLQEPAPPLPGHSALDPVLSTALAKEKDERFATCAELVGSAGSALGLATPAPARSAPGRRGRRRVLLAAGALAPAAAIAAAIVLLTTGGEAAGLGTVGNGVAVIGPGDEAVTSFIESAHAPSNVAVGEGAVWVLNSEDGTVSRIDPETKAVTGRFEPGGLVTDIAAGAGAVWLGKAGPGRKGNFTVAVSRVDPATTRITRTVTLPNRTAGSFFVPSLNWGFPDIAVGAGAVWVHNPDHTLSRLDPETGRLLARIDVEADRLAAGREGVWFVAGSEITRIDPRTNRPGQTIRIGTDGTAIAVGGGSVWVTAEQQGTVWRIEPGPVPEARSIDVGAGVTYVAFGAGAAWAANYVDGTLARIDPATNAVTRIPIGAAQALAAGAGSAWVSTAGAAGAGELPDSVCGEAAAGVREPDVTIVSDLPLQGSGGAGTRAMADAVRLVLRRHGYRAGRHTVGYRSCDDSTAQTGDFENRRCAANANAYARAERLVAVIGPYNSPCAAVEIPILNRAPGGPIAVISPSNTHPGLTRGGPGLQAGGGYRGEPGVFYPTGTRNYFRLRPGDDLQGAALAVLARRLGLASVFVLDDGGGYWKGRVSYPFRNAAEKLRVRIAGSAAFDHAAKDYDALADRVARSGAQGVVIGGDPYDGGGRLVRTLRERLGSRVTIMGSFLFAFAPDVLDQAGRGARGMYATSLDLPATALPLSAAGRAFATDTGAFTAPAQGVIEAGQAAELLVAAIARSDGTRASVLRELRASRVRDGILGSFRFDANGDMTSPSIPILRITGSTPPGAGLPPEFQGAAVDRVVRVPTSLVK